MAAVVETQPTTESPGAPLAIGAVLFLASDLMLFAGFIAAYFTIGAASEQWPPAGVELDAVRPAIFTVVLVASAFTVWRGVAAARAGRTHEAQSWLVATGVLGLAFVGGTVLEFADLSFKIDTDAYGSVYWLTFGVHLLHVLAGLFLIGVVIALLRGKSRAPADVVVTVLAYFWYFLAAMSVALFLVFYVIQ
jgi:cytochrome c oxidase subunit 3